MAERIINITCPNCKHGIKHDTLMGSTTVTPPEEYPEINEWGRCWCKRCQHGTNYNEDGLCIECADKGIMTRLRPKVEKYALKPDLVIEEEKAEKEVVVEDVEEVIPTPNTHKVIKKQLKTKTKVLR